MKEWNFQEDSEDVDLERICYETETVSAIIAKMYMETLRLNAPRVYARLKNWALENKRMTSYSWVIEPDISEIDLKGKYVIMKTKPELNLDMTDRIYFCENGFGCNPAASGTKIYGYFVTDPEKVYVRRWDVVRLATDDEVKWAKCWFRRDKTWALRYWKKYQVDKKKTFLELTKEMGGFE